MATKITKKDNFNALRALAESANRPDLVQFIEHEVELLSKKSASKKPTKAQNYNAEICDAIYDVLSASETPMTVSELLEDKDIQSFETETVHMTSQKISALLRLMDDANGVGDGRVHRVADKKQTRFAAVK